MEAMDPFGPAPTIAMMLFSLIGPSILVDLFTSALMIGLTWLPAPILPAHPWLWHILGFFE